MYPLLTIGPLRMSMYGVGLLIATYIWWTWTERRVGTLLPGWFLPTVIGSAWLGGRLGVIYFQPIPATDVLQQIITVRVFEYSWWTAVCFAVTVWRIVTYQRQIPFTPTLRFALLPLLVAYGVASAAATIGGTSVGTQTDLPWAIPVYGQLRHPVGMYDALIVWIGALWLLRRERMQYPIGWASIAVYVCSEFVSAGFRLNGIVLAGGLHLVQIIALVTLIVARERVIIQEQNQI